MQCDGVVSIDEYFSLALVYSYATYQHSGGTSYPVRQADAIRRAASESANRSSKGIEKGSLASGNGASDQGLASWVQHMHLSVHF
jgi:hypothetical protein